MGSSKVNLIKDQASLKNFTGQLLTDLKALDKMLREGLFETGVRRLGIEQELCFVNENWEPAPVVMKVLEGIKDEHFTTELAKFNMEINLDPQFFHGDCFSQLEKRLGNFLSLAEKQSRLHGAHIILTGILPTIDRSDLTVESRTPLMRYEMITELIHELRGGNMEFRIEGTDQLIVKEATALFEASNTSFQIHYQVDPDDFAYLWNWAEAISAPLMAACTNSPLFLGKRLWRETRIALFEQSVDIRNNTEIHRSGTPRVSFGNHWLKNSVVELFRESIARHKPLLQTTILENSLHILKSGGIPKLNALNTHNGTLWSWNRACYGISDGKPHLRIENRILSAGPSKVDEVANAAFWLGMMNGIPEHYKNISENLEFDHAKGNFFQAAQHGLGAYFIWPGYPKKVTAQKLIRKELIPIARAGLEKAGIDQKDIDKYLGIIEARVKSGKTGSQWILDSFTKLKKEGTTREALIATTAAMYKRQNEGKPVHKWEIAAMEEAGGWKNRFQTVGQVMSTDLFTVLEDDLIDKVSSIMSWKNIRHMPVENAKGQLKGIVSSRLLMDYYSNRENSNENKAVKEIMIGKLYTATEQTPIITAINLMLEKKIGCLPVLHKDKLIGIVTEYDLTRIASFLLHEKMAGPSEID